MFDLSGPLFTLMPLVDDGHLWIHQLCTNCILHLHAFCVQLIMLNLCIPIST